MAQTVTLHYGGKSPIVAKGKNQCRALLFAFDNQCWHYLPDDAKRREAIEKLNGEFGCFALSDCGDMYRFKYPAIEV